MKQNIDLILRWAFPALFFIIFLIAATRQNLKGKPWLLCFLGVSFLVMLAWQVPGLLIQFDLMETEQVRSFYDIFPIPLRIINLISLLCLIPFIIISSQQVVTNTSSEDLPTVSSSVSDNSELAGIKGWLILPAIGLVLGPVISIVSLVLSANMFNDVSRAGYGEIYAFFILVEAIILIFVLYTAVRFFGKKANAPSAFITMLTVQICLVLICLAAAVVSDAEAFIIEYGKAALKVIIAAAIWIPYFKRSKRVKATFVN